VCEDTLGEHPVVHGLYVKINLANTQFHYRLAIRATSGVHEPERRLQRTPRGPFSEKTD